jgi:hypothetical protein
MEAVDVLATIRRGAFDTVYHEHVYCYSLTSLQSLLERAGLAVVDVERIPTQGGSLRVYAQHAEGHQPPSRSVGRLLAEEEAAGVRDASMYEQVGERVRRFKPAFRQALSDLRSRHGRVFGLGCPARGVVILNYCEIGPDLVEAVIDDTPLKQGRLAPGVHIPVISWEALAAGPRPSAYVLLSWNYEKEMLAKLSRWVSDAEVLVPFPETQVRALKA